MRIAASGFCSNVSAHIGADQMRVLAAVEDFYWFLGSMALLGGLDLLLRRLRFPRNDRSGTGRYYALHVLCNAFVVAVHFDDVVAAYRDPLFSYQLPCDNRGTAAIFACHLHHILWYQPLPAVDWVHHFVMIVIMLPLAYGLQPGALLGHGAFFASGLPGGIDYAMLVAVKQGWMESMTEKRINKTIQLWIRAPGCVFHSLLGWTAWSAARYVGIPSNEGVLLPQYLYTPAILTVIVTFFWNGLFFLDRVVDNYATRRTELRLNAGTSSFDEDHSKED